MTNNPMLVLLMYAYPAAHFPRPRPDALDSVEYDQIQDVAVRAFLGRMRLYLTKLLHEKKVERTEGPGGDGYWETTRFERKDLRTLNLEDIFGGPTVMPTLEKHVKVDSPDQLWVTVRKFNRKPGDFCYGFLLAPLEDQF